MRTKTRLKAAVIILAALILIGAGVLIYFRFFAPKPEIEEVVAPNTTELLYEKLGGIGELSTAEYMCTCLTNRSSQLELKGWKIPLTVKEFTISYDGTVKAGIRDIGKTKIEDMGNNRIKVTLPPIEITNSSIDFDSLKVYDQSHNPLNQVSVEDVNEAQASLLDEMERQATEKGLLVLARDNAVKMLGAILASAEAGDYSIEFAQ